MLVIRRRRNERVRIGPDIWVEVTDVGDGHLRLGITAPRDVAIYREELLPDDERFDARIRAYDLGGEGGA